MTNLTSITKPKTQTGEARTIYKLDNGLSVVIQEDHFSPVVAMQVWVDVGGADETNREVGIAHVHEHMLFKGTTTRGVGEIASEIEASGGRINAWTAWDQTVYHIVLASRFADQGLDILADAMQHSSFDPTELHKELGVVLEEWKRGEDMPGTVLFQSLFATAYTTHPYKRPVIGTKQSILAITRPMVLDFYKTHYTPDNMTLVIVGDVDIDKMKALVEEKFGSFSAPPEPKHERPAEPIQHGVRFASRTMDIQEGQLALGFHIPAAKSKDAPLLDLLAHVLGGGESSRLYRRLIADDQVANSISAFAYTPEDPGLFVVTASLESDDLRSCLDDIVDELHRAVVLPVTGDELRRARTNLESEFVYRRQTVQGQARELGELVTLYGDPDYDRVYIDRLHKAKLSDLQRVADEYLTRDNLTVVTVLPRSSKATLTKGDVEAATAALDFATMTLTPPSGAEEAAAAPTAPAPISVDHQRDTKANIVTLDNGTRIIVQEHHEVPVFAVRIGMLGGLLAETPEDNGISNFASEMLTRGTSTRDRETFARDVESLAGDISGFSGRNSIGLSAGFLSSQFEPGMDLVLDALLDPVFDPDEVEKARRELLLAIKNRKDNSAQLAFDLTYETMYPSHPYGMDTLGTADSVSAITSDDLRSFYRRQLNPSRLVISVVGDVDTNAVVDRISKRLARKLNFESGPFEVQAAPPISKVQHAHLDSDRRQEHIVIAYPGVSLESPDRFPLSMLDTILSRQGGRLFYQLRDVEGLAYTVTAFSSEGLARGIFGAYIATDPDNTTKAIDGLLAEFERIRSADVGADELERAQRYLLGSHEINLQTNGAMAEEMMFNELYGLGYTEGQDYAEHIKAVKIGDVRRVAESYLRPEVRTEVTVGPPNGDGETR